MATSTGQNNTYYVTTTLPYVNADPHIGFALEIVYADVLARLAKLRGKDVFFNTGTDEHGVKIYRKAIEEGKDPQEYVDEYADKFRSLKDFLGLSDDINYIRTTDENHKKAAQELWRRCGRNGFIYKKHYQVKYCVGCELEKTDSEVNENGRCPVHPNLELELIDEENYFFKFSEFQKKLLKLYEERPDFVVPAYRLNEIKEFVGRGLRDFSISRVKEKMPWGIPVPGDEEQVMFVWFDALVNYISTLGWPDDEDNFEKFWGIKGSEKAIQLAGKDNLRQQSAMWQAMLMAAELPTSQQIVIHGFITSGGQKMSKSLGNVIDPIAVVKEYGTDALRYFLTRHIHPFEDSDFTLERFEEAYNAHLVNGLGNLVARVMKMAEDNLSSPVGCSVSEDQPEFGHLETYDINRAVDDIWEFIGHIDALIQIERPFMVVKENKEKGVTLITTLVQKLNTVADLLVPFMPETAGKIKKAIEENKKPETLFPRKV